MSKNCRNCWWNLEGQVKAEMHQAVVEVAQLLQRILKRWRSLGYTFAKNNIRGANSLESSHSRKLGNQSFSRMGETITYVHPIDYDEIVNKNYRMPPDPILSLASMFSKVIWGQGNGIHIFNSVRYFFTHIYALSTIPPRILRKKHCFKSVPYQSLLINFPRTDRYPGFFLTSAENTKDMLISCNRRRYMTMPKKYGGM